MADSTGLLNNFPSLFSFTLQSITVYVGFLVLIFGLITLVVGLKRELKRPDPVPGSVLRERYGQTGYRGGRPRSLWNFEGLVDLHKNRWAALH